MNETSEEKTLIDVDLNNMSLLIDVDPGNPLLYHERGWLRLQNRDADGCLADIDKAIELDPDFAEAYASRAFAHFVNKDFGASEFDIERALSLEPGLSNKLDHLRGLMKVKGNGNRKPHSEVAEREVADESKNPRREFLRKAAVISAATAAVMAMPSCIPAVLEGEKTDIRWGKIIDLKRCVGCKACSVACKAENHTPPGIAYHVVMEEEKGTYPYSKREFTPMPCMQCRNSTCIPICPVKATYYREDGVVVVDYDKCIGCRYCIATCPYGSRSFDYGHWYSEDKSNPWETQPSPEYGQHRRREGRKSPIGNVRKCTSCLHRIYNGIGPACASSCMGNAIFFGDLNNPDAKCLIHGVNLQELLARRNYRGAERGDGE
jgi:Fe-S-cluster-containing dehydrogenase component